MATPDLTIHGAGIFGLSVAWAAARRGAQVRVIEKHYPGAGSSGGLVGAMAPHVPDQWIPKKAFQLESLLLAEPWWAEVEAAGGQSSGYARSGRLQALMDATALALAHDRAESAKTLWQGRAEWRVIPVSGADWEPQSPTGFLVHDTLTAKIHPQLAVAALVAAIRAKGGEILTGDHEARGPQVWATGYAGLLELSEGRERVVGTAVKGQAATLEFSASGLPQIFVDGVHIIPHDDGSVAIGSTSEREWEQADSTDDQLEALIEKARAVLPVLADAPVRARWAGLRPRSRSRAPILGPWPGRAGHFVANGGFKIGFGMAPKVAEIMADLVLDGHDAIPPKLRVEASF